MAYLDNIIIYLNKIPIVIEKYEFLIKKTNFIGFIVKLGRISIDLKKVKAIVE